MTIADIGALAESIGPPCSYYQFPDNTGQQPPFICWMLPNSADFYADNSNYQGISALAIELYTDSRDFALEESAEAVLRSAGLTWRKDSEWLDSERMHVTIYTTEVLING